RLRSTTSLTTVASRAIGESTSPGTRSRTRKSPSRTAVSAVSSRSTSASSSPRGGCGSVRRPDSRRGPRALVAALSSAAAGRAAAATSSNRAGWPWPFASLARRCARTIGPVPLLEREDQLRAADGYLADAADGHGRLLFVAGEAGVGKTTFVTAVVAAAGA